MQGLKVGDVVIRSGNHTASVERVTKITPTQIVVGSERVRKGNGWKVGESSSWAFTTIKEATPERVKEIREAQEMSKLKRIINEQKWNHMPLDQLRAVAALLDSFSTVAEPESA